MKKNTLSIFFLFLVISYSEAIPISFRHYKVENGLSENSVFCCLQDSKGFMWFGTKDGLNRFDGRDFVTFHNIFNDKNSIGNNFIRSLYDEKSKFLWIGTEKGVFLYSYEQKTFKFFDGKTIGNEYINQSVNSIAQDLKGNVWIGTTSGLFKYERSTNKLKVYRNIVGDTTSLPSNFINCVLCDNKGIIWVGSLGGGLSRFNVSSNNFTNYKFTGKSEDNNSVLSIIEDSQGNLIIGTISEGLVFFNRMTGKTEHFLLQTSPEHIYYYRAVLEYSPGIYLIGSEHGLILFERATGKITQFKSSTLTDNSLSDNAIYSINRDREGGIWIGTYFGGVNYLSSKPSPFDLYCPLEYKNSVSGKAISQFCEDALGNLWIGTEDGGLNYFNTKKNTFKSFVHEQGKNSISYHNVHSLMLDDNKLWIGTFAGGLNILDTRTGKFTLYKSTSDPYSLSDDNVFSIYKDLNGTIWVGTINGLNKYNPQKNNFDRIPQLSLRTHVYDILQDHLGLIWFATYGRGVFCYNPKLDTWKQYQTIQGNRSSISHNKVISIYLDDKKRLWFGTEGGGLNQYSYESDNFTNYDISSGFPNNVVYMAISENDNLWLSTNKGLVRFNPDTKDIKVFTKQDGLQGNQFNFKSAYKSKNGRIYFGGTDGFNAFYPDKLLDNKYIPPIIITNIQLFNKNITIGTNDSPLKKDIAFVNKIKLKYNQNFLNFEFIALSYVAPEKNNYSYKLDGFDKDWNNIGNNHKISYTNLPPGSYTLFIKGSNNDGIWNSDGVKLEILISPPFWKSIWAYIFYIIALISTFYFSMQRIRTKHLREQKTSLDRVNAEKEIELYNAKIDFFTNIAHEIRTPLSLIKSPLEYILKTHKEPEIQEFLSVMHRNTNRLTGLVNQLLDFRKAEKNKYTVNYKCTDITNLILEIYDSFKYAAESHELDFELNLPEKAFSTNADSECITKIISNLLSNAIKHAQNKVILSLLTDGTKEDFYVIQVYDDGEGINKFENDKIFQPFYQIKKDKKQNQGTGIGLALVKLLTEIHGGKIGVESIENEYTRFSLELPKYKDLSTDSNSVDQLSEQIIVSDIIPKETKNSNHFINKELPTILIVEDNEELNHFLVRYFRDDYSVMSENNGLMAIKALESFSPDIIVSDIVMPEMDGLELCKYVKTNTLYSHIPVILLTAKTDIKYKIEGLEHGADAYIEKPFSIEHLEAQIFNLLDSREKLKANFISSPVSAIRSIGRTKVDETFLLNITEIIESNITNVDFSVEELSQLMAMSRSNLHRKLKGVSGLAPNDFIRLIKLKRAVKLMSDGENRINEICYLVGFNTPSYFAKCFHKQFGVLPKDFIKK